MVCAPCGNGLKPGLIGDIEKVYCWTDRPVWPQGIAWPESKPPVPKELNWDLWLGTAEQTNYIDNLVPFNWRGWWEFGTGALGDMGCHIIGPPFKLLGLGLSIRDFRQRQHRVQRHI